MSWTLKSGRREFTIPTRKFVVGRGHEVDLQLQDESVSRRHALFRIDATEGAVIEDLGSQNGTFVNGQPILGCVRLAVGDRIRLGSCDIELARVFGPSAFEAERVTAPMSRERDSREPPNDPLGALSPREREVFVMLAEGRSQRDIAEHCGTSTKTIETHRTRIGQKLGLKSRAELIQCALAAGVLRPEAKS